MGSPGEMTFASGNGIAFGNGSPDGLVDPSILEGAPVTFSPVDSTSVPFEFFPTLGLLAVGSVWGVSRLRKRAVKLDN